MAARDLKTAAKAEGQGRMRLPVRAIIGQEVHKMIPNFVALQPFRLKSHEKLIRDKILSKKHGNTSNAQRREHTVKEYRPSHAIT